LDSKPVDIRAIESGYVDRCLDILGEDSPERGSE